MTFPVSHTHICMHTHAHTRSFFIPGNQIQNFKHILVADSVTCSWIVAWYTEAHLWQFSYQLKAWYNFLQTDLVAIVMITVINQPQLCNLVYQSKPWNQGLMYVYAQSCPILWDPTDYRLPGSSVHGIFQARILEWVTISSSRDLSKPGIEAISLESPTLMGIYFTTCATWEA